MSMKTLVTILLKHFSVKLLVSTMTQIVSKGRATSKKKAEEMAAKRVYYSMQNEIINS